MKHLSKILAVPMRALAYYPHFLGILPVLVLAIVAVLNISVDPYRIFSADPSALYTRYPALHPNLRLHKAYQVNRQKPEVIVLGTSKAIQGIPLDHEYFADRKVYNLAAPLASMREMYHLLQHAQANGPLKEVLFVVDFLSFNVLARVDGPASGYVEDRLRRPGELGRYWPDYLSATVSFDALQASMAVLGNGDASGHRVLNGRGGRQDSEIASRLTDGGHRTNSQKIESFFVNAVLLAAPHRRFAVSSGLDNSMHWFQQFVEELQRREIKATLVIGPSHTRYWQLLEQAGLLPQFEQWKRELVTINESVALAANRQAVPIWDFSLPSSVTLEAFPMAGDSESKMQFYYESVHFNQRTGGLLLDRISGHENSTLPENFGVQLDSASIASIELQMKAGLQHFSALHPEVADELKLALPQTANTDVQQLHLPHAQNLEAP